MKKLLFFSVFLAFNFLNAQVGINTTTPNSSLDIRSSNQASPINTDGILIPKIDNFPAINPTAAQNAMLVYLTTTVGTNTPGFYFWNNATTSWVKINGNGGTLDQSYDFGGAGNGRTITADAGSVQVNGTDGFVVNGILNNGAFSPSGPGVKMYFNPRKAAFRAGRVTGTQWDNAFLGDYSFATGLDNSASIFAIAAGENNTASGAYSIALGRNNTASNDYSMALGFQNGSSGNASFAAGLNNNASGKNAVTIGRSNTASGAESVAIGLSTVSRSWSEISVGSHNLDYTPISATTFNLLDRIFSIGNGTDEVNRSNALTILKNANTIIGGSNPNARLEIAPSNATTPANSDGIIIPRINAFPATNPTAAQNAMMVYLTTTVGTNTPGFYFWNNATTGWTRVDRGGTLDQAYDFGGAGNGRTITADAGSVQINGTDGFVVTGDINNGVLAPTGAGTKMYFNPRKSAFRVGTVNATNWDDASVGLFSFVAGENSRASRFCSVAFGSDNEASADFAYISGIESFARSYAETTFGYYGTDYTPLDIDSPNGLDRLFSLGNGSSTIRSNAFTVLKNANVGIGNITPTAQLHLSNLIQNRKFVLFQDFNNDHQFYGMGINSAVLRYQIAATTNSHIFYVGTSSTTSNELLRIQGNGRVGIGDATPEEVLDVEGNITLSGSIINEAWQTPTLQNGWFNFGFGHSPARYYKDKENRVQIVGTITSGTINTLLFTLPVGYRPSARYCFVVVNNGGTGRVDVFPDGTVLMISGTGNNNLSLDNITFRAE
jgi:trimeric autotransporter adhesin